MKRFIEGENRDQGTLLPDLLDDYKSGRQQFLRLRKLIKGHKQKCLAGKTSFY